MFPNGAAGTISAFAIGASGNLTELAGSPFSIGRRRDCAGIAIDSKGQFLYAADSANNKIASFSIAAAERLTPVGITVCLPGTKPVAVAVDATSSFVYSANQGSNNVSAFKISLRRTD